MELSFNELKKRDVINIADGKCLGRMTDLKLCFPEGILVGISVPGRKSKGIFKFFDKSEIFIDVSRIVKIGGDVILVDMRRQESCLPPKPKPMPNQPCTPQNPCPPPPRPEPRSFSSNGGGIDLTGIFDGEEY